MTITIHSPEKVLGKGERKEFATTKALIMIGVWRERKISLLNKNVIWLSQNISATN